MTRTHSLMAVQKLSGIGGGLFTQIDDGLSFCSKYSSPMSILTHRQTGGDESDGWIVIGPPSPILIITQQTQCLPTCFHFMSSGRHESGQVMDIPDIITFT